MELLALLQQAPVFATVAAVILGLMVGSFLNVVIHRLPQMLTREWEEQCAALREESPGEKPKYNLLTPRSACPSCGAMIRAWQNIPVASWLALRGRCAACAASISTRYPLVEVLTAGLSGFAILHFGATLAGLGALLFLWTLIALTFIDFDTQLLPDNLTQPLLWLGLLFNISNTYVNLTTAVIGAIAGYLALWSVYWLFKLMTGKDGMGYGDFKLLAAIGAWLGWQILPLTILLSSLVGAVVGIALIIFARHGRQVPIPFGPYLAGGGLISLFWGRELTNAYLTVL